MPEAEALGCVSGEKETPRSSPPAGSATFAPKARRFWRAIAGAPRRGSGDPRVSEEADLDQPGNTRLVWPRRQVELHCRAVLLKQHGEGEKCRVSAAPFAALCRRRQVSRAADNDAGTLFCPPRGAPSSSSSFHEQAERGNGRREAAAKGQRAAKGQARDRRVGQEL